MVRFFVPGKPRGKQRARTVRRGNFTTSYTPKETVAYEKLVMQCCKEANKECQFYDKDIPVEVIINAKFSPAKSTSKKRREQMLDGKIRPTVKPDADNIGKIVCDGLNGFLWHDDSQVVRMTVTKDYSDKEGVYVFVGALEE